MLDQEGALLKKAIEEKELYRLMNADIGKCLMMYTDVWEYLVTYQNRFRQLPTLEIVKTKFPEIDKEDVTDVSLDYLIEEVQNEYIRKETSDILLRAADFLEKGDPREAVTFASSKLSNVMHVSQTVKDVDLANDYRIRINSLKQRAETAEKHGEILGIPSSIEPVDYLFGGWQPGDFDILMGWTGSGKTWLAIYFAMQAWVQGFTPLYFSLEMDDNQFGYRFDTLLGGGQFSNISLMNARGVKINEYEEWAETKFSNRHPFHLVTNETTEDITQMTVAAKIQQYNPDIVFIDYHGLMDDARRGDNDTQRYANISKDLKRIAGRYGVPILDIASVTMSEGHNERAPLLSEIGWARKMAYDSDITLSVWKEGQVVHVESAKTRRCNPFAFSLTWDFDSGVVNQHDWD